MIQLYDNLELSLSRVIVIDRDLTLIKVINNCLSKQLESYNKEISYILCL